MCHKRAFEQAIGVLDLMEKKAIAPNLVTYNTLLHGFYSNGRFADGERIWERMGERDVRSYNSRLRGLVQEKRVSDAVKVFDEMTRVRVKPDTFSFNSLIRGYCQDGMLEEAKKVYLELGKNGCEPNLWTFKMLIRALCEAKDYDFAVRLCNESINMRCYLEVEMLQQVLDGLAKEEMFLKAKKLVTHVRSKVFYASKHFRVPLPCFVM
nr:pentatricopeptide repeat protein AaPPR427 [Agave angustifolia]